MSIKYTWYFFQKILVFSKNFIFFFLLFSSVNAQFNDTLQFKYKDSKVLIVSKGSTDNEWGFENSINEEEHTKTKFKMNFSLGNMQLNTNSIFNGFNSFNPIRYKALSSVKINFGLFFKSFNLKKESLKLFIGVGIGKNKLDLDNQIISISQDTMTILNSSLMSGPQPAISKSILNHHYFTIPINFSWVPFPNKTPKLKTELALINQFLIAGKSKLEYSELDQTIETRNDFFNNKYCLSGNLKFIYKNIGIFFQTNILQYSNLYKDLYTYSYGLTLCI
jgi:opacity protein-like surface antigen